MDPPSVQYATTSDGYNIAYCVGGEGEPLVFMPRPFSHLSILSQVASNRAAIEGLEGRFRLIRYDGRGQGLSTRGVQDDATIELYARDLAAVVDHLHLERVVLLGPLGFGRVALYYASQHPERVKALVLWNPFSDNTETRASMQIDLPLESWDLFLDTHAHLVYPLEEPSQIKPKLAAATNAADRVAYGRAQRRAAPQVDLSAIRTPTLIIAARSGSWSFAMEDSSKMIAGSIPNARLAIFDDLGGGLFLPGPSVPPAVQLIEDFVKTLAAISQSPLTPRENEIAVLVARGRTNRQIADELVISKQTADRHVSNILGKLDFTSRAQLAAWVVERGNTFSTKR